MSSCIESGWKKTKQEKQNGPRTISPWPPWFATNCPPITRVIIRWYFVHLKWPIYPSYLPKLWSINTVLSLNGYKIIWVMLQLYIILQYFYKLLLWSTFYWFSSGLTNIITFLSTNNHSPHQQFVKNFVKIFCISRIFQIIY